jgi:chemotaxis protein CheD
VKLCADALPKIYLRPGELIIAEEPAVITTVLGSCISVVLFSPRLRIGAICHATMPSGKDADPSKYADQSVRYLIDFFRGLEVKRNETIVKLFGGADMFSPKQPDRKNQTIGAQNVRAAIYALNQEGYEPMVGDVGGTQGRKIVFYSHTGDVFRKWVKKELLEY